MVKPAADLPDFAERFEEGEGRTRASPGLILALILVAAVSGLLAWWLTADDPARMDATTPAPAPRAEAQVPAPAAPQADPAQVRRAYDEVRTTYAEGGAPALVDFARQCSDTLASDRRILDFCLAFDMYAQAMAPADGEAAQWFQVAEARRLRLTGEALGPGGDAQGRLNEISRLMRAASQAPPADPPVDVAEAPVLQAPVPAPTRTTAQPAARVEKPAAPKAAKAATNSRCRFEPTPAQRLICANPSLKTADARMQRAYRAAVAAGVDAATLDAGQADFRTARNGASGPRAMAQLYAQRTRELQRLAASR